MLNSDPTLTLTLTLHILVWCENGLVPQTLSLGCHIHNGTYLTLSLTLTITLTLLTSLVIKDLVYEAEA